MDTDVLIEQLDLADVPMNATGVDIDLECLVVLVLWRLHPSRPQR